MRPSRATSGPRAAQKGFRDIEGDAILERPFCQQGMAMANVPTFVTGLVVELSHVMCMFCPKVH